MTILSKALLTTAVTGLAGGIIIDYHAAYGVPPLSAVLPLGAIASGLFLIAFMLEKEVATYDQEQAKKLPSLKSNASIPAQKKNTNVQTPTIVQLKEKTS
jgi:hypothetical protein